MNEATEWNIKRITEKINNIEANIFQIYDGSLKFDYTQLMTMIYDIEETKGRLGDLHIDLTGQEKRG